jgi:phage baseplate assembly protein W
MNGPRYRAWEFAYAGEEVSGLQLNVRGGIATVEGQDAIRQAIFLLLSTVPGERVMRPTYGCHLHRLVFAPNDDTTAGLAIHYVRSALDRWEPRIEVVRLDADRDAAQPERLNLLLEYKLRATQRTELLIYPFTLAGDKI